MSKEKQGSLALRQSPAKLCDKNCSVHQSRIRKMRGKGDMINTTVPMLPMMAILRSSQLDKCTFTAISHQQSSAAPGCSVPPKFAANVHDTTQLQHKLIARFICKPHHCLTQHNFLLTLFRMGFFGAAHRWGRGAFCSPLPKICHTYSTMMQLGTVIPYVRKTKKIHLTWHIP